jgi:hypothetical protein
MIRLTRWQSIWLPRVICLNSRVAAPSLFCRLLAVKFVPLKG